MRREPNDLSFASRPMALVLLLTCACTRSSSEREEPEPVSIAVGARGCDECSFGPEGQCHLDEGETHVKPGESPRDHRVPCDASCCDRFPILGGVALLRPGKPLFDDAWSGLPVKVAHVPRGRSGLLVRITALPDESYATSRLQVETVGARPEACAPALDDLRDVILEGAVESSHLERVTDECAAAVYAAHDEPEGAPDPGAQTIAVGTYLEYPFTPEDPNERHGTDAGRLINSISLSSDTRITRENDMDCFRLPGILRPKVCVKPTAPQRAAEP